MTWNTKSKVEYLETITIQPGGKETIKIEQYNRDTHPSLQIIELDRDKKTTTIRQVYFEEELSKEFEIKYELGFATALRVKIRYGCQIISITEFWGGKDKEAWCQYLFENNKLRHTKSYTLKSPYFISSSPLCVDDRIFPFFDELKLLRPKIKESLTLCLEELLKQK